LRDKNSFKAVKGYGVSFAEKAGLNNHSMNVTQENLEEALRELGENF